MDLENPVVRLCVAVTQAEFAGRLDEARRLSWQAWQIASDDYEACIAAHYVARYQESSEEALRWNQLALQSAQAVKDGRVDAFYPSLYLNLGRSCENLGDQAAAQGYYDLAAKLGTVHELPLNLAGLDGSGAPNP
jgi:tetratricopeptide (TPR) repeat protein